MQKLDEHTIRHRLKEIAHWQYKDGSLIREWQFADFKEAMRFINKVAELAEEHGHHPEIFNVYNRVRLSLSTHDAGGITDKDFDLARAIDQINS